MSLRTPLVAALAAAALALSTAPPATAAVTFDPATGTGFVGKGDVQLALGWNDKQLQAGAGSLRFTTFSYSSSETTWTCTATDGTELPQHRGSSASSSGVVRYEPRGVGRSSGFVMTGYLDFRGSAVGGGPQVDSCPDGAVLTSPAGPPVSSSASGFLVNGAPLP